MALSPCAASVEQKLLAISLSKRPLNDEERWFAEEMCAAHFLPHAIAHHLRAIRASLNALAQVREALGIPQPFEVEVIRRLVARGLETHQVIAVISGMRRRQEDEAALRLKRRRTVRQTG